MKKKALSLLLTSAMVASLAACGSSDSSTSTTTESTTTDSTASTTTETTEATTEEYKLDKIKLVVNGTLTATVDNGQKEFEQQWEDAVGIDLEITQLDHSGYTDAVSRLFVSGEYPDVMIMSADMFKQYATMGILWDMSSAYDNAKFQERLTLKAINENLKDSEGHLYGFAPTYGNGCVTYVKKAWLDACNIDINSIKTFDDYYNMLLAFRNGDPDGNGIEGDTYGAIAAGYIGTEAPWINYLPEFWQDAYPAICQDENGTWIDGFQTEASKKAVARIAKAAAEGALDPETSTASTKIAREKWFSNDQTGSAGVFTYWAGSWYQTLTDNLVKNGVNEELVMLPPLKEVGAYINREAPVFVIIDDGDGDNAREQAIFDAFIETMMDGDKVQTLWTYGAEDVHWSTHAESFSITTNKGKENEKTTDYNYEEGQFHLKQSPNDPNSIWKKNALDPALVVSPLLNGYVDISPLAAEGNKFCTENCVDAKSSPSSAIYTEVSGDILDAQKVCIATVVSAAQEAANAKADIDAAIAAVIDDAFATYVSTVEGNPNGSVTDVLAELNAQ